MKSINSKANRAATLLGKLSWEIRKKRHGLRKMLKQLSAAGKEAAMRGVSGRPRLPDHKVKPASLYQRERRARLIAEAKIRKGAKQYGKNN